MLSSFFSLSLSLSKCLYNTYPYTQLRDRVVFDSFILPNEEKMNESVEEKHYLVGHGSVGCFYLFLKRKMFKPILFSYLLFIPFLFFFLVVMCTLLWEEDLLVSMCLSITFNHHGAWIISHERQKP